MFPTLQIGSFSIPVAQFSLLLAFWFGISLAEKLAPRHNVPADKLYNLVFTGLITGLVGARLGVVFQYPQAFIQSPLSLISLNTSLFDTFSGIAAAMVGMLVYGQRARLTLRESLDALTPILAVLMVGIAFAHIASGQAFGMETSLPWGIDLLGAKRHPSQFYELATATIIMWWVLQHFKPNQQPARLFLEFVTLSAAARLLLDAFRGDSATLSGGFRIAQITALGVMATSLALLDIIHRKS